MSRLKSLLESPFRLNNTVEAHNHFGHIIDASKKFLKHLSPFERELTLMFGKVYASRFKRHLIKIVQYLDVKHLIQFVERNDTKITVLWVPDTSQRQLSLTINTKMLVNRHLDSFLALKTAGTPRDEKDQIQKYMASSLRVAEQLLEVTPLLHPEIHLIMFLTDVVRVQSQYLPDTKLYIGSSKRILTLQYDG